MTVEGVPVVEAATEGFEAGLAEAISAETGDYTTNNSTVLVRHVCHTQEKHLHINAANANATKY